MHDKNIDYDKIYIHIEEWLGIGNHSQVYAMIIDLISKLKEGKFDE